jgi:esterase FrsA
MIAADLFPITRTLEELKAEAQARADRNGYPLAGLLPGEVREALSNVTSLDRDEWAAAWSAIGDRYMVKAATLPASSADARSAHMAAWRYYSFARWPVPIGPGKERAYRKALDAFLAAARTLDPPVEVVRIPFEGKEIVGYLRLPKDARDKVPLIIAIGGLDSRKEDMVERFSVLLPRGIGSFGFDMPGTGEAPVRIGPNAERMFSAVIDYVRQRPEIDGSRVIIYGGSFGGHWGIRLAVTERERLLGVIVQSGPVHMAFQPEFLEKAFVTKEYLFDRGPAIASMYEGVTTPAELLAAAPKNSLLTQGYLEKPMVEPMLVIAGEHDTQVPISDINLLLHSGTPKWSWINPQGGHMGREAKGWVDPVIFQKITVPWILQTLGLSAAS